MKEEIIKIIKEAGSLAKKRFYESNIITEKSPKDLVTEADREIELFIGQKLSNLYPDASFYGEESGLTEKSGSGLFVVDPIDGTANFIFGVPYFAVSLAEIINEKIVLAIVFNPLTGDLFYADSQTGALLNGNPITTSSRSELNDSFVILGFSAHSANISRYQNDWGTIFSSAKKALPLLSPSLNICSVAMGKSDAFIDFGCSYEGQVAAAYILKKAGGKTRNYEDKDYDYKRTGIIATNGVISL